MPLTPGTRLGPYEIAAQIGAGGMGEVYRARDTNLKRSVAIKILPEALAGDPERLARFQREAEVLASLNHPNIAHIYGLERLRPSRAEDVGIRGEGSASVRAGGGAPAPYDDAVTALVMEFVEGEDLSQRIARGPIQVDDALPIARQIAEALEAAHERGIVHRDLKPANVKVRPDGAVKVLDFGLAKALQSGGPEGPPYAGSTSMSPTITTPAQTLQGVILGTAAYMSPEQAKGKPVDRRTDIWAFGCVLYEMLAGVVLFRGDTVSEVLASVIKDQPALERLPSSTPRALRNLIARCLDKDPRRRLRDIGEARVALEALPDDAAADAAAVQRASSRVWQWTTAALAAVALVAGGFALAGAGRAPAPLRPVEFEVPPPDQVTFTIPYSPSALPRLALSPDGRQLAFVGLADDGRQQLWLRTLDSKAVRVMPGTDGADAPFWSPDGRFVGFWSRGLKYVEAAGGPVQVLADGEGSQALGAAWGPDNVVIFAPPGDNDGLKAVRLGGDPTGAPLTHVDRSRGEVRHVWPAFLPDGEHFLYAAVHESGTRSDVFVGSLSGSEPRLLLQARSAARYADPGYVLLSPPTAGGPLLAQRFDTDRLELVGTPSPLLDAVGTNGPSGYTAITVAGAATIAYGLSPGSLGRIVWRDRRGQMLSSQGEGDSTSVFLSPDGRRLITARSGPQIGNNLWLADVGGAGPVRFTSGDGRQSVWSPDGRFVAFASRQEDVLDLLFVKPTDGSREEEQVADVRGSIPTDWSADDELLFHSSSTDNASWDVFAASIGDRTARPLIATPFNEIQATRSPDQRWIAYASDESGVFEIYVQPYPPTGEKTRVSDRGGSDPRWRRDGRELFYLAPDRRMMAVPIQTRPAFEAATPEALFATEVRDLTVPFSRRYDVTADGQRFVMVEPTGPRSLPLTVLLDWAARLEP